MSAAAEHKRAGARARSKLRAERALKGIIIVPVPVHHVEVAELLIRRGLLDPADYDNRQKIGEALGKLTVVVVAEDDAGSRVSTRDENL
jgi:hypothetical protein